MLWLKTFHILFVMSWMAGIFYLPRIFVHFVEGKPQVKVQSIKSIGLVMDKLVKTKIIKVCSDKIEKKGLNVGLSFYAFFANKNDNPELLMEVAKWWIITNRFNHFEKAIKIKKIVSEME